MDYTALAISLAIFGVLLLIISYRRHRHHRDRSAIAHAGTGAILVMGGALLLTFSLNFRTYQPLSGQPLLAEISISKTGKQTYQLSLMRIPSGQLQVFTLSGQQWRIEARMLRWLSWTRWLGLDQNLRLEQLLIEKTTPGKHIAPITTRYALSQNPGINLWEWRQEHPSSNPWYGLALVESDNLPLEQGLRYHLYLDGNRLLAKAVNRAPTNTDTPPAETPVLNKQSIELLKGSKLVVQSAQSTSAPAAATTTVPAASSSKH